MRLLESVKAGELKLNYLTGKTARIAEVRNALEHNLLTANVVTEELVAA